MIARRVSLLIGHLGASDANDGSDAAKPDGPRAFRGRASSFPYFSHGFNRGMTVICVICVTGRAGVGDGECALLAAAVASDGDALRAQCWAEPGELSAESSRRLRPLRAVVAVRVERAQQLRGGAVPASLYGAVDQFKNGHRERVPLHYVGGDL